MRTLRRYLFLILTLTLTSSAWALDKGVLRLAEGKVLFYEAHIKDPRAPVLVFLPGVYRGHRSDDEFTDDLMNEKIPFVFFHFSAHPDSVVKGNPNVKPNFVELSRQDLAQEVAALANHLKLSQPIPVTLSYSAIVTEFLDPELFPLVIEVAPIGKDTDDLPENIAAFYESWRDFVKAFPYGEAWLKATKRTQLRSHWSTKVDEYSKRFPRLKQPEFRERAIDGYIALTMASEAFDLRDQSFRVGPKRYFILGESEDEVRYKIQLEAIQAYESEKGHKNSAIQVQDAGHVVMDDQPKRFVNAIRKILKREVGK